MNARHKPFKFVATLLLVFSPLFIGNYLKAAHDSSIQFSEAINAPLALPDSFYTLTPIADTTIRLDLPNNNYGSLTTIQTDNSPIKNFLVKFNVTGVNNRQIVKATLRLYNMDPSSKGGDFLSMTDTTWGEGTVTWNNAPAAGPTVLASLGAVVANTWYEIDLTSLVQADGVYSLRVTSTSSDGADYASREGVNPPQLILDVSNDATPIPTITPLFSPTPTLSPTSTPLPTNTIPPTQTFTPAPSATPLTNGDLRFAVIGDFGSGSQAEADVATLVKSWNPDFVVTVGDNNYPLGEAGTIDSHIGKYYHDFIYPYVGVFGEGASHNRFFPALGNHDWETGNVQAYLDYFTLPGNERYYDFVQGPVHFFIIDSDSREPDGVASTSIQATWLQNQLAASTSVWNVVAFHHSPYSSGFEHGSQINLQWPFGNWGADVVLSGHDHGFERLVENGFPYIVNGLGGASLYAFNTPIPGSQVRYNGDYGAMLVEANTDQIIFRFYSRTSLLVDTYIINAGGLSSPTPSPTFTSTSSPVPPTDTPTQTDPPLSTSTPTPTSTNTPTDTATLTPTDTPLPSGTSTPTATLTATGTPLPSATPAPTNIPTNTPPASTSTGFLSPSANAAQTSSAGDNNGYQTSPANAYANDSSVATDTNSGTNNNTSCTNSGKDSHRFYNYNFNVPATAAIQGIQVRLDARADATGGSPKICVQLSWDGGTTWTTAKSTSTISSTEATYTLGSISDTWGRTWSASNFSNANFRIRVINVASNTNRDFFLDYVALNVTYQP